MKSAKMAISGIFPSFSSGKKILKNRTISHILDIANTHLCAKNHKKTGFPAYFRHFRPENLFFFKSKIQLRHILGIAVLHLCFKNQIELMGQSREKLETDGRTDRRMDKGSFIGQIIERTVYIKVWEQKIKAPLFRDTS